MTVVQAKTLTGLKENTDITDRLNREIKVLAAQGGGTLQLPAGTFNIDAVKSINLRNNIRIILDKNTTLKVIPNAGKGYQVFNIKNVNHVSIENGTLIGDKYHHLGKDGQWGMGISIKDAQHITVKNMKINQMWGDAIYIGTSGKNNNYKITLNNIQMDDNRRQGISVTSVNNLLAENLVIKNTSGIGPQNGIDIEPNDNHAILQNISFKKLVTLNNKGVGFQASLKKYNGSSLPINISLDEHQDTGSLFGIVFSGLNTSATGTVNVSNVKYKRNHKANFCFSNWRNNRIKVNFQNMDHDIRDQLKADPWCEKHYLNRYISIKNASFKPS